MSLISGEITKDGAAVTVYVAVSVNRQKALERLGFKVPERIPVLAQLDTGSFASGFRASVFQALDIPRFTETPVRTPSTQPGQPHVTDVFDVSIVFAAGSKVIRFPSVRAIVTEDFAEGEEDIQAIIGRDVLDRCSLHYYGPHREFTLALPL